ncbi:MAG: hypothetical protein DWQ08_09315 [Proteobacteria bacterium]|nr:MAG: hypothetical protein DWQ08_09315 [Pseudomonadota bacterium]
MRDALAFNIRPQPDDTTCGPTCLHAVYRYYGLDVDLADLVEQTGTLNGGGTLAAFLGSHALERGFDATIYTYDLKVFDPTWFDTPGIDLVGKLAAQLAHKHDPKLSEATGGYLEFLNKGGRLRQEDLTAGLIRRHLKRGVPILTGLSATYLYRTPREYGPNDEFDDIRGHPSGHFVVMHGYDPDTREVRVADPTRPGEFLDEQVYHVSIYRVICAVMLGVLTYDANLLMIEPRRGGK